MTVHKPRLTVDKVDHGATRAVLAMETYVRSGKLERPLLELVRIRASQINGCAFCLDMHHRDAREAGEAQRRLDVLSAWHETDGLFSEREEAALALTEAVTRIADGGVAEDVWQSAAAQFTEEELVQLLMAIATINVWNRLAVSTRQQIPDTSPESGTES